ncbi:hypothetical protein BKA62DRAFT_618020 [Auriculariales sp. MPI-PUGE-AT-0066]|nr:hypothetical protein BKA62DRAFT_618020 [Auriculariales sp. MPI-PUGE-AT-0066]
MEDEVLRPTRHPDDHVNARGDETGAFAALAAAAALCAYPVLLSARAHERGADVWCFRSRLYSLPPPARASATACHTNFGGRAVPVPTPTTTPLASPLPDVRVTSSSPTPSANSGPGAGAGAGASARRSMTPASSGTNRAANRLSGFFSHLFSGDGVPSTSGNGGDKGKERASTPPPPPPPPPPALPPPTLAELGLTLSAMTTALSSGGGGSSAPASGTFVLPHFLLLCAPHGLDVLPLAGPGTGGLLALVRRVPFKSVVVMEERGVVVAIAGRRDTVRVYALEEVRRMIEWRVDGVARKSARSATSAKRSTFALGGSNSPVPPLPSSSSAVVAVKTKKLQTPLTAASTTSTATSIGTPSAAAAAAGPPPSYAAALVAPMDGRSAGMRAAGAAAVNGLGHGQSASTSSVASVPVPSHVHAHAHAHPQRSATMGPAPLAALAAAAKVDTPVPKSPTDDGPIDTFEQKRAGDWMDDPGSDDEALVAVGPGGSAALDERTSAAAAAGRSGSGGSWAVSTSTGSIATLRQTAQPGSPTTVRAPNAADAVAPPTSPTLSPGKRKTRPADLDLSTTPASPNAPLSPLVPLVAPAPTLLTLRQSLQQTLSQQRARPSAGRRSSIFGIQVAEDGAFASDAPSDVEELDDSNGDTDLDPLPSARRMNGLQESRIPEAPPLGSRSGPTAPPVPTGSGLNPTATMINPFNSSAALSGLAPHPAVAPLSLGRRWSEDRIATARSASASGVALSSSPTAMASTPPPGRSPSPLPGSPSRASNMQREPGQGHQHTPSAPPSLSSTPRHRFLPRIITAAFGRSSSAGVSEEVGGHGHGGEDGAAEREMRVAQVSVASMGPPKMEFVKLPGTKGAMMVKAVETARKSFLAILCGEQGEKVELFAGTYKTALGLSRTFILPDSPRNLELQLQGDDLVEIFLVFGGNVFGLEPATVRVREVRIGRQERRARRRARQARAEGASAGAEDDVDVQVNVAVENSDDLGSLAPPTPSQELEPPNSILAPASAQTVVTSTKEEEDQMGPYTTFQQLNFAPTFPLGTIADECIIPPSYPNFVRYREDWEGTPQDAGAIAGPVAVDAGGLSPPGLPTPPSQPPTRWFYKDPKGVVQGPFKTAMMQGWFKDGFLPLDLPVRREVETEYTLLRDLRAQSVDPTQPFKPQPLPLTPPAEATAEPALITIPTEPKPLLPPVSLLKQPKHFGPPALFFSSRGGHSTSVVDARGKSVLKGRLMWSAPNAQAGEVRRVEAFDVQDRAVVVALRRSALEAIDVGDALLNPGDDSRAFVPEYSAAPVTTNRRSPFVWRIGAPLNPPPTGALRSESTPNLAAGLSSSGMAGKLLKKEKPDWMLALENDLSGDPLPSKHASQEEVLFLGREGDNVFFAEKSASHFRVLRLAPTYPQSSS